MYTIDRWRFGAYAQTIEVTENGITWSTNTGVWLYQTIENWDALVGKTATVSALIGGNLYSVSGVVNNSDNISVVVSETVSLEISPAETERGVRLVSYVTNSTSVSAVLAIKLELGSQQTLAHQENGVWVLNEIPKFGDQLADCQRYALNMIQDDTKYTPMGIGVARSATEIQGKISIPVQMRALPAISTNAADWLVVNGGNYLYPTTFSLDGISPALVDITFSGQGFSTGVAYEIFVNPGGKCILSADL